MKKRRYLDNPLAPYYHKTDYGIVKNYLCLPQPYLVSIFAHHKHTLQGAPMDMVATLQRVHANQSLWLKEKIKNMSMQEQLITQKYQAAGVPPSYCVPLLLPKCDPKTLDLYSAMTARAKGFAQAGRVVYMHSHMGTMCLSAAAGVVKAAIDAKVPTTMLAFPEFMERAKLFEQDHAIKRLRGQQLVCLYMLGTEYLAESGFTQSVLEQFVLKRKLEGKSTILCSHLPPKDFNARYALDLQRWGAIPMAFEDAAVAESMDQLMRYLKMLPE